MKVSSFSSERQEAKQDKIIKQLKPILRTTQVRAEGLTFDGAVAPTLSPSGVTPTRSAPGVTLTRSAPGVTPTRSTPGVKPTLSAAPQLLHLLLLAPHEAG